MKMRVFCKLCKPRRAPRAVAESPGGDAVPYHCMQNAAICYCGVRVMSSNAIE